MQCCAVVRATCRKQQTPQLWMEGRGRSVDSFVPWNRPTTILSPIAEEVSLSPEERCPFSKGDRYKDYVTDSFPGPNFVSPEWSYPLNRGAQKEIFRYNIIYYFFQIQVIFEKEEVTAMKTFGDPGMIHCNSLYRNWGNCINTRKYCNLIGSYQ